MPKKIKDLVRSCYIHIAILLYFSHSVEENISNPNVDENEMVIAEPLSLPLPKELEHLKAREHDSENFNTPVSSLEVSPYLRFLKSYYQGSRNRDI